MLELPSKPALFEHFLFDVCFLLWRIVSRLARGVLVWILEVHFYQIFDFFFFAVLRTLPNLFESGFHVFFMLLLRPESALEDHLSLFQVYFFLL